MGVRMEESYYGYLYYKEPLAVTIVLRLVMFALMAAGIGMAIFTVMILTSDVFYEQFDFHDEGVVLLIGIYLLALLVDLFLIWASIVLPFDILRYWNCGYTLSKDNEIIANSLLRKQKVGWDKASIRYLSDCKKLELTVDLGKKKARLRQYFEEGSEGFETLVYLANFHNIKIENV